MDCRGRGDRALNGGHGEPAREPRLFLAVPIPDGPRETIIRLVEDVRAEVDRVVTGRRAPVRWVRTEALHLTLRFLGPTPPDRAPDVAAAAARAAEGAAPFQLTIAGGGTFPGRGRPRVLWLGVTHGAESLAGLAARVDDELARDGWPRSERPYRAHLTLARADGRREGPLTADILIERAKDLELHVEAASIVLFDSVTGSGAARYEPLADAKLRA